MQKEDNLEKLLEQLLNHKIHLVYTPLHSDLRETYGILRSFNKDIIHIELYDEFGEAHGNYYLNRHGCVLHSIVDFGQRKE